MNKHKRQLAERFLNHVLEIIYLWTGEEYTIVKKNFPHNRIQKPTGEVPIKCDDVAVYFSMEEWEYIEGHRELYKDVITENQQTRRHLETLANRTSGEANIEIIQNDEIKEKLGAKSQLVVKGLELQENSSTGDASIEVIQIDEHLEELSVRSQLEVQEQELQENSSTGPEDDNQFSGSIYEEVDEKKEFDIQQVEICSALYTGDARTDAAESAELIEELSVENQMEIQKHEIQENLIMEDGSIAYNIPAFHQISLGSQTCLMDDYSEAKQIYSKVTHKTKRPNVKAFTSTDVCVNHRMEEKPFACSHCGEGFTCNANLIKHKRVHKGEKPFACLECGKSFGQRSRLKAHTKVHIGLKPFSCSECGKCFISSAHLIRHQRIHTKEKPFACAECGKCFSQKGDLVRHWRIHTREKPFACAVCGNHFTLHRDFVIHQRSHSRERRFYCSECGKYFSTNASLVKHKRVHTGERPYACSDCGKCFSQKGDVARHQRSHRGERPFTCSECGKRFTENSSLIRHHQIHTGNQSMC